LLPTLPPLMRKVLTGVLLLVLSTLTGAQSFEQRTARYLDSVRKQPPLLLAFVRDLPKGGDLHNHLSGAIYAEDLVDFAASGGLCVDRISSRLLAPPCDSCENYTAKPAARCAYGDHVLYNQMIDAWSMRNWKPGDESGHDHFFATFDKFGLAAGTHTAEAIAAALNRAGMDHLQYVEFMHTADSGGAAQIAGKVDWNSDLAKMRDSLLGAGLKDVAAESGKRLAADEARAKEILKCGTADAGPGCDVTVRYLYQVLRG
jgi:adenosine deaminase